MNDPTFADLGVSETLTEALAEQDIIAPFPIQEATIPDAIAGKDVCGKAPTGSGKTLAFGLPILANIGKAKPGAPKAMILAPTRELAEQIYADLQPLAKATGRWVTAIYGGMAYGPQRKALAKGVDVLVATPGRLGDLIDEGDVRLDEVEIVVIDEADRMADMGFLPVVKWLVNRTPKDRQTLLFSATLDGDVAVLSHHYQNDPVRHEVAGLDDETATDARHFFWKVSHTDRTTRTMEVIEHVHPAIVFCETRNGADRVARQLKTQGVKVEAIHGGRPQAHRNRALDKFSSGKVDALVATDVAARGIHVDGVAGVVHYDPPQDAKAYLHRSGRTARAGASGVVVSMVRPDQELSVRSIQRELGLDPAMDEPAPAGLGTGGTRLPSPSAKPKPKRKRRKRLL
jgi:superfamily II DNA/RNA helicase